MEPTPARVAPRVRPVLDAVMRGRKPVLYRLAKAAGIMAIISVIVQIVLLLIRSGVFSAPKGGVPQLMSDEVRPGGFDLDVVDEFRREYRVDPVSGRATIGFDVTEGDDPSMVVPW